MRRLSASFVLGYHGCRQFVGEKLLAGADFEPSDNAYDWLGPGIYFWKANPLRGLEFMREKAQRDGFGEKTHVQIAIRDAACIKGVFRVPSRYLT